jgi:O-succinylbenzoate synthase
MTAGDKGALAASEAARALAEAAAPPCLERKVGAIDHVDFVVVRLPFLHPFSISAATWTCKEALLLRLEADGLVAWGECVADPDPFYAGETTTSCAHILEEFLVPLLDPALSIGEVLERARPVRGNGMARGTLENALIDLAAKREGRSLHEMLGRPARPIMSGVSLGIQESAEALVEKAVEAAEAGYHRIKMKVKRGKDVEYVRAVREALPDIALMVDANGDYALGDAAHLARLDEFGLTMIEQPLGYSDIYQHSKLQRLVKTPLCLDESILCLDDAVAAVELGACGIVNIKQGRVGGLVESIRIARYCEAMGVPVWSGGMDETGIGRAANIQLQTDPAFSLPGDTAETARYFELDLVEPPVTLGPGGWISVPPGPGIGVEVQADRLDRLTISRQRLK